MNGISARWITADVRDMMAAIPDSSVDLIITSPPFLALRSYLPDDHPDKGREIGQEETPGAFLGALLELTNEWERILAPHGSLCVELGDTYSGSGGGGGDYDNEGTHSGQPRCGGSARARRQNSNAWPLPKSLCFVPQLYGASLAYGHNLLTGEECRRWRVRNVVRWCRPNPPVGALADKFRPATSEIVIACAESGRYWDPTQALNHNGSPLLDWWEIPNKAYSGAHFATWNPELVYPLIPVMCPRRVCTQCGEPSMPIMETRQPTEDARLISWTDCGHNSWRRGLVLDPFAGSGTTGGVAIGCGRDFLGCDIDKRNVDLARDRIGPMFFDELDLDAYTEEVNQAHTIKH